MISIENTSLKEYIHLLAKRVKDPPFVPEYDEFLLKVWTFFSLRVEAESFYKDNKHCALSPTGALPVSWHLVKKVFFRDQEPPEQMITLIAKTHYNDVYAILQNMRKVLNRVRQKVAIGRVQQVDSHCLRWLTRQPGRSAAEKGGSRQEILGIVRVENYNTLENRVLKDFLFRCLALSTMYLRKYDKKDCHDHVNIKAVIRFKNLCVSGLSSPEFEDVVEIREFPQPNYVLQQDRLYSKIWRAYSDIMKQEDVAERLWGRKQDVDNLYDNCLRGIPLHCSPRAKFNTPLWMNVLDGKKEIFENPIWKNELLEYDIAEPNPAEANVLCDEVAIIDFTFPWDGRDELFYPSRHRNARPFIQNKHRPSLEPGTRVSVSGIIRNRDATRLADYLRQVYGLFKKKRWVILVPDDWDAQWQETVLRGRPSADLSRDRVFLLWRSVAVALGQKAFGSFSVGDDLVIGDGYDGALYNATCIRYMKEEATGRILPQRSSVRLHGGERVSGERRFRLNCSCRDQSALFEVGDKHASRIIVGKLNRSNIAVSEQRACYVSGDEVMYEGVRLFLKNESQGLTSYFDELDELSLVIQTRFEEVKFKTLVKHDECSPGGKACIGDRTCGGTLQQGASKVSLNLLEGEQSDNAPLKTLEEEFGAKTPATQEFFYQAEITPGQGLATVMFSAAFLPRPIPLDLTKLESSGNTKSRIEREMKRHFPPVMPYVEASEDMWFAARPEIDAYMSTGCIPDPKSVCYRPQPYWGDVGGEGGRNYRLYGAARWFDEAECSPIDRLKREHVFGNSKEHPLPRVQYDWNLLFKKMANDYQLGKRVLRLIAWTYQGENPAFEFLRRTFHRHYVRLNEPLEIMEITFCANNFADGDERVAEILEKVITKISNGVNGDEEYRLAYNLLQFHPSAIENISSDLCERAFMRVYRAYNMTDFFTARGFWAGASATKKVGYLLKCMLFLLHRRRYDSNFLSRAEDWEPSGFLAQELPTHTDTLVGHEAMRKSFLNYVRGHGSIDGIPMGD